MPSYVQSYIVLYMCLYVYIYRYVSARPLRVAQVFEKLIHVSGDLRFTPQLPSPCSSDTVHLRGKHILPGDYHSLVTTLSCRPPLLISTPRVAIVSLHLIGCGGPIRSDIPAVGFLSHIPFYDVSFVRVSGKERSREVTATGGSHPLSFPPCIIGGEYT